MGSQELTFPNHQIIEDMKKDIIGEDFVFQGPFGPRKCLYLDQTASGKPLKSVETFVMQNILPIYANTHSTTSFCASQVSQYREEARNIVKESCGGCDDDVVIFCGSGSTGAIHKLVHAIVEERDPSPVVILGPFEHHSNILPWRNVAHQVIVIPEDEHGLLDVKHLEKVLEKLEADKVFQNRIVIGAFSAASNVTGAVTDDIAVTIMMHKYGGFSVWDYSAAAPHVTIDMNPDTGYEHLNKAAKKDAIFFSGHKFTGGPQTTGILMAKKYAFLNPVPHGGGGGGTVLFVTKTHHKYLHEISDKEEAGTPNIIGSIRLGLVLQLKNNIGTPLVVRREHNFVRKVLDAWSAVPEIKILGYTSMPRLPIVSLLIQHIQTGMFLHHDFVVGLLNDLFGIQCRGGCMCAGPFGQSLLGINEELAMEYERILPQPRKSDSQPFETFNMIFKPGFIRISLPFHASDEEIDFTIDAVKFVAKHGYKFLPYYSFNIENGTFRFTEAPCWTEVITNKLHSFNLSTKDSMVVDKISEDSHPSFSECLAYAENVASIVHLVDSPQSSSGDDTETFSKELRPLRWFLLPSEATRCIKDPKSVTKMKCPFTPRSDYKNHEYGNNPERWANGSIPHQICSILKQESSPDTILTSSQVSELFRKLRLEGCAAISKAKRKVSNATSGFIDDSSSYDEERCDLCKSSNVKR